MRINRGETPRDAPASSHDTARGGAHRPDEHRSGRRPADPSPSRSPHRERDHARGAGPPTVGPRHRADTLRHDPRAAAAGPYAPDEQYAAGEADRAIVDTDVVLWFTLGVTHIPRPEDWPYMSVHRGGFRLVPTSFCARNPTLDVPETR